MIPEVLGQPALHHVGIVVHDLEAAVARYRTLGFGEPEVFDVADQGVRVASFHAGPGYVELLTPTVPDTGVARFLEARGDGMHHVAFGVRDLDGTLRRLAEAGIELIDAEPRRGIHDWRIAFLHPRSCGGVLVELVEVK